VRRTALRSAVTESSRPVGGHSAPFRISCDTRLIISASQIGRSVMITRVSGVIRPTGLGDLRSPVSLPNIYSSVEAGARAHQRSDHAVMARSAVGSPVARPDVPCGRGGLVCWSRDLCSEGAARERRAAVRRWRLVQSHSRAVLSWAPTASSCPSGLNATAMTEWMGPVRVLRMCSPRLTLAAGYMRRPPTRPLGYLAQACFTWRG